MALEHAMRESKMSAKTSPSRLAPSLVCDSFADEGSATYDPAVE